MAISKFDMFDFLIDIVPREEQRPTMQQSTAQVRLSSVLIYVVCFYLASPQLLIVL